MLCLESWQLFSRRPVVKQCAGADGSQRVLTRDRMSSRDLVSAESPALVDAVALSDLGFPGSETMLWESGRERWRGRECGGLIPCKRVEKATAATGCSAVAELRKGHHPLHDQGGGVPAGPTRTASSVVCVPAPPILCFAAGEMHQDAATCSLISTCFWVGARLWERGRLLEISGAACDRLGGAGSRLPAKVLHRHHASKSYRERAPDASVCTLPKSRDLLTGSPFDPDMRLGDSRSLLISRTIERRHYLMIHSMVGCGASWPRVETCVYLGRPGPGEG
jgi:hypothetical protein